MNDFSLRSENVTFSPGQERATVAVSLTQDTMCDAPEESFTIDLEIVDSGVSLGLTNTTQVFIEDDDGMTWVRGQWLWLPFVNLETLLKPET